MKKIILFTLVLCMGLSVQAQVKVDTTYYDKNGRGVSIKEFADYYRIALYADESETINRYRDFHMNGQIMSSGEFISLDKKDDRNSRFVGSIVIYDKNGNISAARNYKNGLLHGISEEYSSDGTIIQEEFIAGVPAKDHYIRSDKDGNIVKIRYADNSVIWDSPLPSELSEDYHEGEKWQYFTKNGVTVALNTSKLRDYGKYHALNLTISNNSLVPIEFEPSHNITASSVNLKKNDETQLKVYSCEEYIKKYDRRTAWEAALIGVSEIITTIDSGISEEKTVTVNDKGEQTVSYSKKYSPFEEKASWEVARMQTRDFSQSKIDGREVRRVGYFKRSTIYPGDSVSGFAYVQRVKGDEITVNIDIEGAIYTFSWNFK